MLETGVTDSHIGRKTIDQFYDSVVCLRVMIPCPIERIVDSE